VVAVLGLGFVGAAVAPVIADAGAESADGQPSHFVIGLDLPSAEGLRKIAELNAGRFPFPSPDPALPGIVRRAALERKNLVAAAEPELVALADVIVVDLPLDAEEGPDGAVRVDLRPFEAAMAGVGRHMRPEALVVVETTVPVGACEKVVRPILERELAARGEHGPARVAHAYERVMPGPRYVESIRNFWRVYSGVDQASADMARSFLEGFCDVEETPLARLDVPAASEMAKLLENSYRAANIAFIQEWTLFAEQAGVNLFEVVAAIRKRRGTHDNIRQPGLGVGGYCLTKDALLAQWSAAELFGSDVELSFSRRALRVNAAMPLHTASLARQLLPGGLDKARVAILGVSYLPDVPDVRSTPSATLADALIREGARVAAHDPCLDGWDHPAVAFHARLEDALAGARLVILACAHRAYLDLSAQDLLRLCAQRPAVLDAQNILDDAKARILLASGCRVAGVGKGHWRRMGYHHGTEGNH
jgi:nucleotide sugar dehydrogenase